METDYCVSCVCWNMTTTTSWDRSEGEEMRIRTKNSSTVAVSTDIQSNSNIHNNKARGEGREEKEDSVRVIAVVAGMDWLLGTRYEEEEGLIITIELCCVLCVIL